ncbi:MAG: hypothetical protein IJU59_06460 [Firmicutes bacterium]|nr:hypothetical protein [Bacillota bacterium]
MENHERQEIWVKRELENVEMRLRFIDEEVERLPEGKLLYLQHGKHRRLARSVQADGKRKVDYLTSIEKRGIAQGLFRKELLMAEAKILRKNKAALEGLGKKYVEPSHENIVKALPLKLQELSSKL